MLSSTGDPKYGTGFTTEAKPDSEMYKVGPVSGDLVQDTCLKLRGASLANFSGTETRPDYQHTIQPRYSNTYFFSEEGNKGTETCQNTKIYIFSPLRIVWLR